MSKRKAIHTPSPLFKAAWQYKLKARRARQAGGTPLTDDAARAAAAGLLKTAAQWHQEWLTWRIELGRPPQVPSEPLPPPETRHGAVIRAAKSLGYAHQIGSPDKAAQALALLEAAEALPYQGKRKRRPAVSPPAQAEPAEAPGPAPAESQALADHPEPVEG